MSDDQLKNPVIKVYNIEQHVRNHRNRRCFLAITRLLSGQPTSDGWTLPLMVPGSKAGGALQACKGVPHAPEPQREGAVEETGKWSSSAGCLKTVESLGEQAGPARGGFGKRFLGGRKE